MAIGLRVMQGSNEMMYSPLLHEIRGFIACELKSTIGTEAKWDTDIP